MSNDLSLVAVGVRQCGNRMLRIGIEGSKFQVASPMVQASIV